MKVGQIVLKFKGEETHTHATNDTRRPLFKFQKERGPQICFNLHQNLSVTSRSNFTQSRDAQKVRNEKYLLQVINSSLLHSKLVGTIKFLWLDPLYVLKLINSL